MDWINTRRTQTGQSHIAIDGKVMKKSWAGNIHNALQVVSAYDVENGLSLYQQSAQSKGVEGDTARQGYCGLFVLDFQLSLQPFISLACRGPSFLN